MRIVIKVRDHGLSVRGLAAYLAFTDRVYGRFAYGSLERYRNQRADLEVVEIRRGSVLLVLREALHAIASPEGLALAALVLKFLPDVIKAPPAAYRDYEEGRFRRAERKRLAQRASTSTELQGLSRTDLRTIVGALVDAYEREYARLAAPQEFAITQVEDVVIAPGQGAPQGAKSASGQPVQRKTAGVSKRSKRKRRGSG